MDWKAEFESADGEIRAGRLDLAVRRLQAVPPPKLPREWRRPFAMLCRRAGLITLGLRILAAVVRAERELDEPATPEEGAEYAVLLQRFGGSAEAGRLLDGIDARSVPDALLFRSFCHFDHWEYEQSVPLLNRYLESEIAPYMRFVGQVNLADALIFLGNYEHAEAVLAQTLEQTRAQGHGRLAANCLEMRAQIALLRGDLPLSEARLNEAASALSSARTLDELHLRRWRAVLEAMRAHDVQPLRVFRQEALERGHFESLRVADLYTQKIRFDQNGFDHLCFGTPFPPFLRRLERELGRSPVANTYQLGAPAVRGFELAAGTLDGMANEIAGSKRHIALHALLSDFYRPHTVAGLFAHLFPDQYFDVHTSGNRVNQVLVRTRAWLEQNKVPAAITSSRQGFRLTLTGAFAFTVTLNRAPVDRHSLQLARLAQLYPADAWFATPEAAARLGLHIAAFRRLMSHAMEAGRAEKFGAGNSTRYRLIPERKDIRRAS